MRFDIPAEYAALQAEVNEMQHMLEDYLAFARGDGGEEAKPTGVGVLFPDQYSWFVLASVLDIAQRGIDRIGVDQRGVAEEATPEGATRYYVERLETLGRLAPRPP